ncbi:MAG: DUF3500 domain-containing protein [Balneolaceae bacterium]
MVPDTNPAVRFLQSLNDDQRDLAQKTFDYLFKEYWHYLPGNTTPRTGLRLDSINEDQKKMVFELLRSSLSEKGYDKTRRIIDLENVLAEIEGNKDFRDPDKYFIEFFGNPETDSLWAWSFQGHHLSFHFTILNGHTSIAPRFMGASPAMIMEGPRKGEKTLHREEDLGFELLNSLSDEQRKKAIFREHAYYDVVITNSIEVGPLRAVGIRYDALNTAQKLILMELINEYLSVMPAEISQKRIENLKQEELSDIMFGWAGATERGIGHYYRVQGASFLIEFDNTQGQANHIHSVWRDFDGDFGRDLIREHYENSNH